MKDIIPERFDVESDGGFHVRQCFVVCVPFTDYASFNVERVGHKSIGMLAKRLPKNRD